MGKIFLILILGSIILAPSFGQDLSEVIRVQDSIYKINITKTRLYGVYIPKNLDDALEELDRLADDNSKKKFISIPEQEAAKKLYYGIGRWMSYNWNFVEGSRFSKVLNDLGLVFEEDQIHFMLQIYHRKLSNIDLDADDLANSYVERRQKEKDRKKEVLQSYTIQRDSTYIPD